MTRLSLSFAVVTLLSSGCGEDGSAGSGGTQVGGDASGGESSAMGGAGTGGSPATGGGAPMGGGGAGGGTATVPCDGGECAVGEVCCFDNSNNMQVRCDSPGQCDGGHIELSCDHPDDCPGGTCCSQYNGVVQTMACTATCEANDEYVMCSGPDQTACPPATTCSNAQAGQGYHYCAP